jgi:hypothetical protein
MARAEAGGAPGAGYAAQARWIGALGAREDQD